MFLLGYPQCSWRGDVFLTLGSRKTETLSHKHRMCKKYLFVNGVSTSIITTQDGSTYRSVTRYKFIIEANPDYGISFFKVSTKTAPLPLSKKKKKGGGALSCCFSSIISLGNISEMLLCSQTCGSRRLQRDQNSRPSLPLTRG